MLGYIGNTISFVVQTAAISGSIVATYAYFTKPSDESFKRFLENYFKGNISSKSDGPIEQLTKKMMSKAGANLIKPEMKDFGLRLVATLLRAKRLGFLETIYSSKLPKFMNMTKICILLVHSKIGFLTNLQTCSFIHHKKYKLV